MPIQGVKQPEIIRIEDTLRLRKFDGKYEFALKWYQDEDMVYLVDGVRRAYDMGRLTRMYTYLNQVGELYFIEVFENGSFQPIGDVTFWQDDLPIVIGEPRFRGKGIGRKILSALVQRGRMLEFDHMCVGEIYDWNEPSRRCFESLGFRAYEKTEKGSRYRLDLKVRKWFLSKHPAFFCEK